MRLFWHWDRRAASRAEFTAGKRRLTRTPMIPTTTSSSTSVKAVIPSRPGYSELLFIDRLPVGAMPHPLVDREVDLLLHEPHRAVAEGEVGPVAGVGAAVSAHEGRRGRELSGFDPAL